MRNDAIGLAINNLLDALLDVAFSDGGHHKRKHHKWRKINMKLSDVSDKLDRIQADLDRIKANGAGGGVATQADVDALDTKAAGVLANADTLASGGVTGTGGTTFVGGVGSTTDAFGNPIDPNRRPAGVGPIESIGVGTASDRAAAEADALRTTQAAPNVGTPVGRI